MTHLLRVKCSAFEEMVALNEKAFDFGKFSPSQHLREPGTRKGSWQQTTRINLLAIAGSDERERKEYY